MISITTPTAVRGIVLTSRPMADRHVGRIASTTRGPCDAGESITKDDTVSRAIALMESNVGSPMTIGDIALRLGVSPRHLGRLFVARMETTPVRFYIGLRLRAARRTLLHTDKPIAGIAAQFGFKSASHFTDVYGNHFGTTPSADRPGRRNR